METTEKTKLRSPMLATDYEPQALKFPCLASPKLDGIRCHIVGGVAMSRSGKPIRNDYIQSVLGCEFLNGLDGELVVGDMAAPDVYNRTYSGVMKKDGKPEFKFITFDWYAEPSSAYLDRLGILNAKVAEFNSVHVDSILQIELNSMADLDCYEADIISQGFEGVMLRAPESPYKFGRSTVKEGYLLKVKRFAHDEAKIIGFEELMHNGNEATVDELGRTKRSEAKDGLYRSGMIGAYVVENPRWPKPFNVSCGSMSHDEKRVALLKASEDLGRILRFKHLPHGAKDVPRHPLFAGFRDEDDL